MMLDFLAINYKFRSLIVLSLIIGSVNSFSGANLLAAPLPEPELNPLEIPLDDPLIPSYPRPLTPFEQRKLREALDQLNADAQAQLAAGNDNLAFEIWYRELRLRRVLGRIEEINALGRVGEIAWNRTRTEDVQIISKRLVTLQQLSEKEGQLTPEILLALADAYAKLHSLDNSIIIYQKVLENARQTQTPVTEKQALKGLGRLYLAKFDYPNAALIYEELLEKAQREQNTYEEGVYLQALAEIYTASLQAENAANIKQRLVDNYLNTQQTELIPPLKIEIGKDYQTMEKPELASQNYQEAYSLAWSLQLFGAAAEALTKLGELYQTYEQEDYALEIYQTLLQVEQLSYNYYGLMQTYDKIGEIYLEKQQYQQALNAFQQGLILARSINYKQDHFLAQLQKVNQGMQSQPETIPENNPVDTEEEFNNEFNRDNRLIEEEEIQKIENELNELERQQ